MSGFHGYRDTAALGVGNLQRANRKTNCIWDRVNVLCILHGHSGPVGSRYEIGKRDVILNPLVLLGNRALSFTIKSS